VKLFVTRSNTAHLVQDCPYLRPGTKYDVLEFESLPAFLAAMHWTQVCRMCKDPNALAAKRTTWNKQMKLRINNVPIMGGDRG
jgi:hypothetical protein